MNGNFKEIAILQASTKPDFEGKLLYLAPPKQQSMSAAPANVFAMGKAMAGKAASKISGAKATDQAVRRPCWFRLRSNLLFYFKDAERAPGPEVEPTGLLVLEGFHIQREDQLDSQSSTFSIIFMDNPFKRHTFTADQKLEAYNWETHLRNASFFGLQHRLKELQARLGRKLEQDPLLLSDGDSAEIVTSKLLTSSQNQIESLNLLDTAPMPLLPPPPQVRPRSKKKAAVAASADQRKGFVLHNNEENKMSEAIRQSSKPLRNSAPVAASKSKSTQPTFKVHVDDGVAVGELLDL